MTKCHKRILRKIPVRDLLRQGGPESQSPGLGPGPKNLQPGGGVGAGPRRAVALWWTPGIGGGLAGAGPGLTMTEGCPRVGPGPDGWGAIAYLPGYRYKCASAFLRWLFEEINAKGKGPGYRARGNQVGR